MKNLLLTQNVLYIYQFNGSTLTIYLNQDSGKQYYRMKVDTISNVKHPGIYLGNDIRGVHYMMHLHYENGVPCIVTMEEFCKGMELMPYETEVVNTPLRVIEIGLREILRAELYDKYKYNCQTYVNIACNNTRKSEDVDKWVVGSIVGGLLLLGVALVARK